MTESHHSEKDAPDVAIGARIRMLRKMLGLSQPELASAVGLSFQQVQRYEAGESALSVVMMAKFARALGVAPGQLLEALTKTTEPEAAGYPELSIAGAAAMLKAYSQLDPRLRSHILAVISALAYGSLATPRSVADH